MKEHAKILLGKRVNLNDQEYNRYLNLSTHPGYAIYDIGRSNDGKLLLYVESSLNYPRMSFFKYIIGKRGGVNKIIYSRDKYSFNGGY